MEPMLDHFDRLLSRFNDAEFPPLIITIGLGEGHLLRAVQRRSSTAKVLALEPCRAKADTMLATAEWRPWLEQKRLTVLVGPDYEGRTEAWRLVDRKALKPPVLVSPSFEAEHPDDVTVAKGLVRQIVLGAQSNEEARRVFSGPYLLNTIENLPIVAGEGDAAHLDGLFRGMAAVVVAAGPSLDENLATLRAIKDRVIVVSVDTALRPLLAAGIRPTIVVGVDPGEANARHLRDLSDTRGTWFVSEGSLLPDVFTQFAGRTFIYKVSNHHPWPWLNAHGIDCGTLLAWGSVVTTAFDLACRLGADPIVFAGADLAYTGDLPYCRNTTYEPEWSQYETTSARAAVFRGHLEAKGTITLPDMTGADVLTAPRFVQFRDWLVSRAGKESGRRVINGTGGGILHGGRIEQQPIDSITWPEPVMSPSAVQERLAAAWRRGGNRQERIRAACEALLAKNHEAIAAWLLECGEKAPAEEIVARLAAARRRLMPANSGAAVGALA